MSLTRTVTVADPLGLHARPAAQFVEAARVFASELSIAAGGRSGNCKSLLSILALGISHGTEVTLEATGDDEEVAVQKLASLLEDQSQESTAS